MEALSKLFHPTPLTSNSSIPLPKTQSKSHQDPNPQSQSAFFSKLPLEVRLLIYQSILDSFGWGSSLHIVSAQHLAAPPAVPWAPAMPSSPSGDQLTNIPCAAWLEDPFLISGTHYGHWPRGHLACSQLAKWRTEGGGGCRGDLRMLGTSQRLYEEITDLLYPNLRFDLLGVVAAERFLTNLTPSTLVKMQSFHLSYRMSTLVTAYTPLSECEAIWSQICTMLPLMTSLQDLRIAIFDDIFPTRPEARLLEPLLSVEVPNGRFVVELNTPAQELTEGGERYRFMDPTPFIIERRTQDLEQANFVIDRAVTHGRGRRGTRRMLLGKLVLPVRGVYNAGRKWYDIYQGGVRG